MDTCIILCADDYAISPGVSRGILELLDARRITAASCMTTSGYWQEHAAWLRPFVQTTDIGLHLSLTTFPPLTAMKDLAPSGEPSTLKSLFLRASTRRLRCEEIVAEFEAQLDIFEAEMGCKPAFIDGHHHVHQFPVIREALLSFYERRFGGSGAYLRVSVERPRTIAKRGISVAKSIIIAALGVRLRREARKRGIPTNSGFGGIYEFSTAHSYSEIFPRFLVSAPNSSIIMCHPGRTDDALSSVDNLTEPRDLELDYFLGTLFPRHLTEAGVRLCRFCETGGTFSQMP